MFQKNPNFNPNHYRICNQYTQRVEQNPNFNQSYFRICNQYIQCVEQNLPLKGEASVSSQGDVTRQILRYKTYLKPYSRRLRHNMTNAEIFLWHKIRRKQIHNIQFLRQKPVERFILDFYAKDIKLAIEVDGNQHFTPEHKIKDMNRDAHLASLGIYTLRFTNSEVLKNCSDVLSKIGEIVLIRTSGHPPAS